MKKISLILLLFPSLALAAGAEFSLSATLIQTFNFSLFAVALVFVARAPVQGLFHKRKKDFLSFEEEARALEKKNKEELKTWKEKVEELKAKEKDIKKKASQEALLFKEQKMKELEEIKEGKLRQARFLLDLEKEKAKKDTLEFWLEQIAKEAESHALKQAGKTLPLRLKVFSKELEKRA